MASGNFSARVVFRTLATYRIPYLGPSNRCTMALPPPQREGLSAPLSFPGHSHTRADPPLPTASSLLLPPNISGPCPSLMPLYQHPGPGPRQLSRSLQPVPRASSSAPFSLPWGDPRSQCPSCLPHRNTLSLYVRCLTPAAKTRSQDSLGGSVITEHL